MRFNNPNQLGLFGAREARDKGIARVTEHNERWHDRALKMLGTLAGTGRQMTGEEMRLWLLQHGLDEPSHWNAWGALTRHAALCGLLSDTGKLREMETKKSHARRTPVWIFK